MVSLVATTILTVPTSTKGVDNGTANALKAADKIVDTFLHDKTLLTTLADQSSTYIPPSPKKVMSVLWAMMNAGDDSFIDKSNLKTAVLKAGGGTATADALWAQINPERKSSLSVGDFSVSEYLLNIVTQNLDSIAEAVDQTRKENAAADNVTGLLDMFVGKVDNILSPFSGSTGTAVDIFS
jgi:ABC-type multidrug transport system fused ATPase/permease subunit